ncbi:MAG: CinA family protein [Gammaproteobacteria bacterium]|nr:CinA family protein [Gammaproteobacteria bacterium]MDE0247481.1 CinA family protein [Gammaproteobacteria bacterium]
MTRPDRGPALLGRISETFSAREWRLAIAESCTGGLVSTRLTDLPGSSLYMNGAFVTYADAAKVDILGVEEAAIRRWGAVSAEVATQMARGVARVFRADVGLAVTGIAGPGGGLPAKPVGTVWFAVSDPEGIRTARARFPGDRAAVREAAVWHAIGMLLAGPRAGGTGD